MPAEQYHDFPLAPRNRTWDKNTAIPRLRRWASRDGSGDKEQMDWQKYRKVFFWHESGELSDFGQFKFPYCDIIDGGPHVVRNAVQNALARIEGSDIPEDDKPAVRRVAQRQMSRFQDDDDDSAEEMRGETLAKQFGVPTSKQMEMINRLAKVKLQPEQVFVFPDKLVGDMVIPDRYIQIHKSLLNVFKKDAQAGVSLLLDHSWAGFFGRPKPAIAYGRTFDAQLKKSDVEGEEWALFADHYIVRGKEIDGISTDSIIASIQDGTFFDTSIGWGADTYECSICGNNYMDFSKCQHYIGREYDGEICYVIAKPPGFLMENSIVFDGAYPGAGVMSRDGTLENAGEMVLVNDLKGLTPGITLFHTYSSRKGKLLTFARREDVEKKIITQGVTLSKGGEKLAEERDKLKEELEKESQEEQEIIKKMEQVAGELDFDIYLTRDEVEEVFGEGCEIEPEELLMYAKEGEKYLTELREEAEKWGIRAKGDKYNKKAWETRFELMSADELKDIIETFKAEAEIAIPAGRKSDPEAQKQGENDSVAFSLPDEAYGV